MLKSGLKVLKQFSFTDYLFVIGAASAFYGVFCIYKPASFILLGAGLIYMAVRLEGSKEKKQ